MSPLVGDMSHPQYTRTSCSRGLASSLSSNASPQPSHNREPRPSLAAWAQPLPSPPILPSRTTTTIPRHRVPSASPFKVSCHGCSCLFAAVFSPWLDHRFRQSVANTMKRSKSFSFSSGSTSTPRTLFFFLCLFASLSLELRSARHSAFLIALLPQRYGIVWLIQLNGCFHDAVVSAAVLVCLVVLWGASQVADAQSCTPFKGSPLTNYKCDVISEDTNILLRANQSYQAVWHLSLYFPALQLFFYVRHSTSRVVSLWGFDTPFFNSYHFWSAALSHCSSTAKN